MRIISQFIEQFSNVKFYLVGPYPEGDIKGLLLNIILAILSISLGFIFGILLGYSRLSRRIYVKLPCVMYIETVRSTPLIIMIIFWFYFFIPYMPPHIRQK